MDLKFKIDQVRCTEETFQIQYIRFLDYLSTWAS
jgi:hypothetical protein